MMLGRGRPFILEVLDPRSLAPLAPLAAAPAEAAPAAEEDGRAVSGQPLALFGLLPSTPRMG
jgi:hypothetical protein